MQLIQAATGFLVRRQPGASPQLLGSCCAFRHPYTLLTAAHCVRNLEREAIGFAVPSSEERDEGLNVREVTIHPTADIAVVRIDEHPLRILEYFWGIETAMSWGDAFVAFGFPEDVVATQGPRPTPRMFRGYVQRLFEHTSHLGYKYVAAELSVGAPAGLSGGPVCWTRDQSKLVGIVAENLESSTYLAAIEELEEGGNVTRHETRNMINYALAVSLHDVADWLDEVVGIA
jgi:hypothetical protein